jgi:hypothetical protein
MNGSDCVFLFQISASVAQPPKVLCSNEEVGGFVEKGNIEREVDMPMGETKERQLNRACGDEVPIPLFDNVNGWVKGFCRRFKGISASDVWGKEIIETDNKPMQIFPGPRRDEVHYLPLSMDSSVCS